MSHGSHRFWKCDKYPHILLTFGKVQNPLRMPRKITSEPSKVVRDGPSMCCFYILTWIRASRHNGIHFFEKSTSKSGPSMVCFVHFDLAMCFAPQRRAIFNLTSGQMAPHPPLSTNHWKNAVFRDFPTFSCTCIFFLLTFSSLIFFLLLLSSLLSSSLLWLFPSCFSSVHIAGSLTSKLPSVSLSTGLTSSDFIRTKHIEKMPRQSRQICKISQAMTSTTWTAESLRKGTFPEQQGHQSHVRTVHALDLNAFLGAIKIHVLAPKLCWSIWYHMIHTQ